MSRPGTAALGADLPTGTKFESLLTVAFDTFAEPSPWGCRLTIPLPPGPYGTETEQAGDPPSR